MKKLLNTVILGASGYTGAELIRFLLNHPHVDIKALSGDSQAGKPIAEVYPHLAHAGLPDLVSLSDVNYDGMDVVFCCLPHGTTQDVIAALPKHVTVFDLSADFRLKNIETYAKWYGHAHKAQQLQQEAVYGLTEHARDAIKTARITACPGCYPTSAQLPLIPLLKDKLIESEGIVIDSKSAISGAGRSAKQANLYTELNEGFSVYGVGNHRHAPEIEQGLSQVAGKDIQVRFTPHLVPMNRGILSTIYVKLAAGKTVLNLRAALEEAYANEPFVQVLKAGVFPATQMVRGTNQCMMNVFEDRVVGHAIIVSVIDNLVKGASGQAVQNMNVKFGFEETLGLPLTAVFP
jgi:N-acetyl-gamma-glutamyl-phosphate reductase